MMPGYVNPFIPWSRDMKADETEAIVRIEMAVNHARRRVL